MGRFPPLTLWRHMLAQMARLVGLTAAVLVTVLSFAATVRWFADGKLGPVDTLRFMVLALPPMLHYTLPFAAAFGATLAYHRMAQDNELAAAYGGGISHRAMLVPAAVMGLGLTLILTVLNEEVSPRFLRRMESLLTETAAQFVIRTVREGQPIQGGRVMVHADHVERARPPEGSLATDGLLLLGVAMVELDDDGQVVRAGTAERGYVWLFPAGAVGRDDDGRNGRSETVIRVELHQASGGVEGEAAGRWDVLTTEWIVPIGLDDDPKFLTRGELRAARLDPDRINVIDDKRRRLAHHIAARIVEQWLRGSLASERRARLSDAEGNQIVIRADGLEWVGPGWEIRDSRGRGIEVDRIAVTGPGQSGAADGAGRERVTRYVARRARLLPDTTDADAAGPTLLRRLILEQVQIFGERTGPVGAVAERLELPLSGLSAAVNPLPELLAKPSSRLLAEDALPRLQGPNPDPFIAVPADELIRRMARFQREVLSKEHERLAMAVACLVMTLTGAVTAMRLGPCLPLVAYLWSFFPALGAVLTISGGQQVVHQVGPAGLVMLWGGVAGLACYSLVALVIVARH